MRCDNNRCFVTSQPIFPFPRCRQVQCQHLDSERDYTQIQLVSTFPAGKLCRNTTVFPPRDAGVIPRCRGNPVARPPEPFLDSRQLLYQVRRQNGAELLKYVTDRQVQPAHSLHTTSTSDSHHITGTLSLCFLQTVQLLGLSVKACKACVVDRA